MESYAFIYLVISFHSKSFCNHGKMHWLLCYRSLHGSLSVFTNDKRILSSCRIVTVPIWMQVLFLLSGLLQALLQNLQFRERAIIIPSLSLPQSVFALIIPVYNQRKEILAVTSWILLYYPHLCSFQLEEASF